MQTIRTVCAHDCPDMCSLLVHTDNGRIAKIEGDSNPHRRFRLRQSQPRRRSGLLARPAENAVETHRPQRQRPVRADFLG